MKAALSSALALFVVAAVALAADLQPSPPVKPAAKGDRTHVDWHEQITQRLERTQEGVPARSMETTETTDATWTQEVVEVRAGQPALVRVTIETWQRVTGSTERLVARVVRVKPIERLWEPEVHEPALSGAARRFVDRLTERMAGAGAIAAVQSAVLPPAATASGATWSVSADAIERLLLGAPYTVLDAARTRVTARVASVEPRAQVVLEGTAQLFNAPGTQDRFTKGGACAIRVDASWSPGERPGIGGTVELHQKVEGAAAGQLPDGTPYRTIMSLEYLLRTSER